MKEKKKVKRKARLWPMCAVGQLFARVSLPPSWFVQQKRGIEIKMEALRMEQHPIKWCRTYLFEFHKNTDLLFVYFEETCICSIFTKFWNICEYMLLFESSLGCNKWSKKKKNMLTKRALHIRTKKSHCIFNIGYFLCSEATISETNALY